MLQESARPFRKRLIVEDRGDVTVVSFADKKILDEQNIQVIGEQLFSLVQELGRKKLKNNPKKNQRAALNRKNFKFKLFMMMIQRHKIKTVEKQ